MQPASANIKKIFLSKKKAYEKIGKNLLKAVT